MHGKRRPGMLPAKEVGNMTLTGKDAVATAFSMLVVLTFLATNDGWVVSTIRRVSDASPKAISI